MKYYEKIKELVDSEIGDYSYYYDKPTEPQLELEEGKT